MDGIRLDFRFLLEQALLFIVVSSWNYDFIDWNTFVQTILLFRKRDIVLFYFFLLARILRNWLFATIIQSPFFMLNRVSECLKDFYILIVLLESLFCLLNGLHEFFMGLGLGIEFGIMITKLAEFRSA